jgi:hypothetical protein
LLLNSVEFYHVYEVVVEFGIVARCLKHML